MKKSKKRRRILKRNLIPHHGGANVKPSDFNKNESKKEKRNAD